MEPLARWSCGVAGLGCALAVVLAYIAIAVVNTLVMATAARGREFALLRLIGTGRTQIMRMMRIEALLVVGLATVLGALAAIPPLVGISLGPGWHRWICWTPPPSPTCWRPYPWLRPRSPPSLLTTATHLPPKGTTPMQPRHGPRGWAA
jgi:hypothetical protein